MHIVRPFTIIFFVSFHAPMHQLRGCSCKWHKIGQNGRPMALIGVSGSRSVWWKPWAQGSCAGGACLMARSSFWLNTPYPNTDLHTQDAQLGPICLLLLSRVACCLLLVACMSERDVPPTPYQYYVNQFAKAPSRPTTHSISWVLGCWYICLCFQGAVRGRWY